MYARRFKYSDNCLSLTIYEVKICLVHYYQDVLTTHILVIRE